VAGINMLWTATETSIRQSIRSAVVEAARHGFASIAVPAIGAGSGRFDEARSFELMKDELQKLDYSGRVILVRFHRP
jgi:O-acetyl-ADP-ribose deacetylase (regulator of RNase III)